MADTPAQDRHLKLPRVKVGERWVTKYDPDMALRIIEQIAEGKLLKQICTEEKGMPHFTTFHKWVARVPELRKAYDAARQISALMFEEDAHSVARESYASPGTAQKMRAAELLINQLRWSATRRNPTQFSDKGDTNIVVPIHIQTSLDLGGMEQGATKEHPDIYTLELNPEGVYAEQLAQGEEDTLIKTPEPKKQVLIPPSPPEGQMSGVEYAAHRKAIKAASAARVKAREENKDG